MTNTDYTVSHCASELQALIEYYKNIPGALLPVLIQTQKLFGFLSDDTLSIIANGLHLSLSQVKETASFYSLLYLSKPGKNVIHVCNSSACHVTGSSALLQALEQALGIHPGETSADNKFTLLTCGCLGACAKAPALMANGRIYGPVDINHIEQFLSYLDSGVL